MHILKTLIAFATAAAAASAATELSPQAKLLIADIEGIDFAVRALTDSLREYKGGINATAPVTKKILAIHAINRKGYADAMASKNLGHAGSKALIETTRNTVGKSIPISVNVTKAKKPLFDDADLSPLVVASLKLLLNDHDTFTSAVGRKLTSDLLAGAAVAEKIHNAIQGGINYYNTNKT